MKDHRRIRRLFDRPERLSLTCAAATLAATVLLMAACAPSEPVVNDDAGRPPADSEATVTPGGVPLTDLDVELAPFLDGFDQPLYVTGAGDGSGRLFVVEKGGVIHVVADGTTGTFLDISDRVSTNSERGLLGLAFAPDFGESGVFYVDYTDRDGTTTIARVLAPDPSASTMVDFARAQTLLTVPQPYSNHNAGWIGFGPDGYLYVTLGDGGSGGDPQGNGQNTDTLLGSLLRIDVKPGNGDGGYAIPDDNPFVTGGGRAEIWSYGLRNPWRVSFDRQTGDMWIGDVGQNMWEEIDFQPASSTGGQNWGWNAWEGTHRFAEGPDVAAEQVEMPIVEYDHSAGNSVTGGYVYRGEAHPQMDGVYLYGDFGSGRIWGLRRTADGVENRLLLESGLSIVSFGEDDEGELYVVDFGGVIYRVRALD